MVIMSVDLGKARTGIAASDETEYLAYPVCVVEERDPVRRLNKVAQEVKGAALIAVGLPKNMDGTEGESARAARSFAEKLTAATGIQTVMVDERCTTVSAHGYLNETNVCGKKRKAIVDSVAAVVILQSFLDSRKNRSTAGE